MNGANRGRKNAQDPQMEELFELKKNAQVAANAWVDATKPGISGRFDDDLPEPLKQTINFGEMSLLNAFEGFVNELTPLLGVKAILLGPKIGEFAEAIRKFVTIGTVGAYYFGEDPTRWPDEKAWQRLLEENLRQLEEANVDED